MIHITIPGKPVGKGRPRFTRNGRAYTPKETRDHETRIAIAGQHAMKGHPPHERPLEVRLKFVLPDKRRRDIDNLIKTALDGLNGIAYKDDTQVTRLEATKTHDKNPYTEIMIIPT